VERSAEIAVLGEQARRAFEEKHRAREITIGASRRAIQSCAASIRATHRGEFDSAAKLAEEAREALREADDALEGHPDVRTNGPLYDAKKELAEAFLTLALVQNQPLPTADDLNIEIAAYCNGLAEAASELRRQLLDRLRHGELSRAEELIGAMDDIYSLLVTVDYPDGVTGGLRRTTDALRAVLERTRGDLTTAMIAARLQSALEAASDAAGPA
jgi:translin